MSSEDSPPPRPDSNLVELPGSTIEASAGVSDSQLGVLSRQAQWALDEAAHDFPAGRVTAQRHEELATSLEALAVIVRASTTTTETRSCASGGEPIPLDSGEAPQSSLPAGSGA